MRGCCRPRLPGRPSHLSQGGSCGARTRAASGEDEGGSAPDSSRQGGGGSVEAHESGVAAAAPWKLRLQALRPCRERCQHSGWQVGFSRWEL